MKNLLLLVSALAIATSAFGQKAPKELPCAVMGGEHKVNIAKATKDKMFADYKGKRYFFCCAGCPSEFKKNPAKYAKAQSIPTPATEKKK